MSRRRPWTWLAGALLAAAPCHPEILVTGKVEFEEGAAPPEVVVHLLAAREDYRQGVDALAGRLEPEPVASVAAGADGLFELRAPAAGLWVVRVTADGFVTMDGHLRPLVEEIVLPAVELKAARPVEVVVRDPEGAPVSGAIVTAVSKTPRLWVSPTRRGQRGYWTRGSNRGVTDGDGVATLQRATEEKLEVRAFEPGSVAAEPVAGSDDRTELRLRQGRRITVGVSDRRGQPVTAALVRIGDHGWPAGLTDEQGRLATLISGTDRLRVLAEDGARADTRAGGDGDLVPVTLIEPVRIAGAVIDAESRRPIDGALVWSGSGARSLVRTGGDGRFSLAATRRGERAFLQAEAPGYFRDRLQVSSAQEFEPVIALQPAAAATGDVVDAKGEPVAGAELTAVFVPDGPGSFRGVYGSDGARTRSGEDGSFRLGGLSPRATLEVEARVDGYAPATVTLEPLEPHEVRTGLRLVLEPGVSLSGTVMGSGLPVAGAEISILREHESSSPFVIFAQQFRDTRQAATTDGEGLFEYRNLAPGRYRLTVKAAGYAPLQVPGVEVSAADGGADLATLELEPGVEIVGIVVDGDGQPVEGAEIRAQSQDSEAVLVGRYRPQPEGPAAVTGVDGRFVVADRRPGERVDLNASRDGFQPAQAAAVEAPNETPVRIVLERSARIAGTVVDPGGGPVAGAIVTVRVEEGSTTASGMGVMGFRFRDRGTTDDGGRFVLEQVPPGKLRITASAEAWMDAELGPLEVAAGGELEGLRLALRRGAAVTGRVLGTDGLPAIGVTVMVEQERATFRFSRPKMATTGGDGRYLLDGVEPGLRLIVAQTRTSERTAKEIEVTPGVNTLDLRFGGGVEISGRVLDAAGAPLAGATITALSESRDWRGTDARSADDGSFTLSGVRDGQYQLRASRTGYATRTLEQPLLVTGGPIAGIEIVLATGGTISGRMFGLEPAQIPLVSVMATRHDNQWALGQVSHDGSYRIADLAPGAWNVMAMIAQGRQASGRVTLAAATLEATLDLDFSAGLALAGQVLRSGQPLAGVHVWLQGLDVTAWAGSKTDHDGRFRVEGVKAGRHRLAVTDLTGSSLHQEEIELDGDRDVLIEIATGRVAGRVLDAEDLSTLAGAMVSLARAESDQGDLSFLRIAGGQSDAQGRFTLGEVSVGRYRMRVVREGYAPAELDVAVTPGGDLTALEVLLEPSGGLRLAVRGFGGSAVAEVRYAVLDANDRALTAGQRPADESGLVRLPSVPEGSFELLVAAPGAAVSRLRVEVPGPVVAVTLEPSSRLQVVVAALADEETMAKMRIIAADGRPFLELRWGQVTGEWQLPFGARTVEGLPSGSYQVEVEAPDGRTWTGRVDVAPGAPARLDL